MEPESTFQIKLAEEFPELSNLSQLELEAKHKELYVEAWKKAEAAAGGVLEGRNKVAFKTAFKKKWGVLLIPDRKGHYFKGRLGDAPIWRVRYGDKTFVPTIADHATQQQRLWRGQFLTNAGVGTPLSLEQLKRKFIDPLTGLTLSAHHRDGLSEANPYIDDIIAKLVNGQVHQKTKGKYGSKADIKAGNREFQQFQRVFEKRKIASGDVLEQFDMVMEPLHTKSKPTEMGGGAIHVQQSLEGVSTASGKPLTDKLPDGTPIGDLDVEVRANAYVDEVERVRPIKDRIVKDALANPDLYPPINPPPIEVIKRGKDAGKPKDVWEMTPSWQTLADNPDIGLEGVRELTPKQGWPTRNPSGITPSDTPDPWDIKLARQLFGDRAEEILENVHKPFKHIKNKARSTARGFARPLKNPVVKGVAIAGGTALTSALHSVNVQAKEQDFEDDPTLSNRLQLYSAQTERKLDEFGASTGLFGKPVNLASWALTGFDLALEAAENPEDVKAVGEALIRPSTYTEVIPEVSRNIWKNKEILARGLGIAAKDFALEAVDSTIKDATAIGEQMVEADKPSQQFYGRSALGSLF